MNGFPWLDAARFHRNGLADANPYFRLSCTDILVRGADMQRRALFTIVLLGLFQAVAWPALADKRVAFVVGNARYEKLDALKNPKRDAAAIADRLKDLGFEVFELFDADAFAMGRAADAFLRAAQSADLALFYFAGHGVQLFDRNFLLARDVDPLAASEPAELGIDLAEFMGKLKRAGPVRQALLIDACRDNPLSFEATISLMQRLQGPAAAPTEQLARSVKRSGLANVALPQQSAGAETLVFFAAQPGNVSLDGSGQNSYFAEGLKEGFADPTQPLMETFRKVTGYVRTVTNGSQVPQVVSDWTRDVVLGARDAAKVAYNIYPENDKQALTKPEEQLLVKSVSGYSRFKGDFIARASVGIAENLDLSDADKQRAKALGTINGLSLAYDLDRDGREEVLHLYFRQTNYILVVEKDGVRTEVDTCFGADEVTDVEIALRDINGDRRPEVWIAYDTGTQWSTFCVLEFRGIPGLDSRRRGNTGQGHAGTEAFRTLLRGGAGWSLTVGNDNSIKACAGSNCHSPSIYSFDGERFRLLSSELDDDAAFVKDLPFRDERQRAEHVYGAYRQAAKPVAAGELKATVSQDGHTTTLVSQLAVDGVEFGYTCDGRGANAGNDAILVREPKERTTAKITPSDRFAYAENLAVAPVLVDNVACPAESIGTYEKTHRIYLAPDTADRCIPLLARARTVTLPLLHGEHALLQVRLPPNSRRLVEAWHACRSGKPLEQASNAPNTARPAPAETPQVPVDTTARITRFVTEYLQESGAFATPRVGANYADSVDYFKQRRSRQDIVADKARYAARWPTRTYALVAGPLKITPLTQPVSRYEAAFEYTFRVANAKEAKEGRGVTRLTIALTGDILRILSEDGEVLRGN